MKNYILKIRFAGDDERTEYIPFEAADDNDAAQRADAAVKAQVGTVAHAEWMSLGESAGEVVIAKPITERVKTLEDAIRELGEDNPLVQAYKTAEFNTSGNADDVKDVIAYLKLRIIVKALNEGWEPNHLDGDEYRYIPWFRVSRRAVYVGGSASSGALAGLVFVYTCSGSSNTHASIGARLCFKSRELAEYAGNQFIEIYHDYLLNDSVKSEK